jgi:hypothetical protein
MTQAVALAQQASTGVSPGFRNRIINGGMTIDQRNAGASVTQTTSDLYTLDRYGIYGSVTSKFTVQQNAGSVTPPVGFTNYLGVTSSSAYTVGAGEQFVLYQIIEGYNLADLGWGTANAKTVTLSFWARSSLTGTFGGSIRNNATDRSYPFTYTISAANTWEQKAITITGCTDGTWLTTNGKGAYLTFSMGAGSSVTGTPNVWATGSSYVQGTGSQSLVGTSGATLYITGVQLEVGSTATSFDYRPFSTEFALCQRYFETNTPYGTAPGNNVGTCWMTSATPNTVYTQYVPFAVSKRSAPTVTVYRGTSGSTNGQWAYYNGSSWVSAVTGIDAKIPGLRGVLSSSPTAHAAWIVEGGWTADSEL